MEIKIGDYNMSDFGLQLLSVDLGSADVDTTTVDIPGRNGSLDLTEAITGYPTYKNAKHTLTFDFQDGSYDDWIARSSALKGKIHGRRLPVVLGNDTFYYDARVSVDTAKLNQCYSKIEITLDAMPYKLALLTSVDPWEWDTFSFDDGIIREYSDITVKRTKVTTAELSSNPDIVIVGGVMPTSCTFEYTGSITEVYFDGTAYTMPASGGSIPDILITEGEHNMTFIGSGTVSVIYREGRF
jgi:hypothetical protein